MGTSPALLIILLFRHLWSGPSRSPQSHLRHIAGFDPGEVATQVLLVQIEVVKGDVANDLGWLGGDSDQVHPVRLENSPFLSRHINLQGMFDSSKAIPSYPVLDGDF